MNTKNIVFTGIFSSIAFVLMATITIPIMPSASFLRYDPSEIVSIIASVLLGPKIGVAVCFLKDILYLLFRARSIFGPISDFIASSVFTFTIGIIYYMNKSKKSLIMGGVVATLARILIIIPLNIVILRLQFGLSINQVFDMLLPILIPFNFLKSIINFLGFYILYSSLLNKSFTDRSFI
jgi:riboflavin transporter FmnP